MATKTELLVRLDQLVAESHALSRTDDEVATSHDRQPKHWNDFCERRKAQSGAWLTSAIALVRAIQPDEGGAHREGLERVAGNGANYQHYHQVRQVSLILEALRIDLEAGLSATVADEAVAIAFDDLVRHSEEYLRHGRIDVAGVIVGVAFEDAMRRKRVSERIEPADISINDLIQEFRSRNVLTKLEARRALSAGDVRTSATHARWEEFGRNDVEAAIALTRQLIHDWFGP